MMESVALSIERFEQRALASGAHFPFGSKVLEYLVSLVNDPEVTAARLSAVVGWNPILTRSVASQVSSTYGLPGRLRDMDFAVAALGSPRLRETLKRTVASIATRHMVSMIEQFPELWNHLIACALVARSLSAKLGVATPDAAFLAGLVHDVGFLMLREFPASMEGNEQSHWKADDDIVDPGQTSRIALHEEAGLWMVQRWETLPCPVGDAVRHHHSPRAAEVDPMLAALVHVADVLCHRMLGGPLGQWPDLNADPWALTMLQIDEKCGAAAGEGGGMAVLQRDIAESVPSLALRVTVMKESLVEGLENLSEGERLMLALHYSEGISVRSIAGVMDETAEGVLRIHGNAIRCLIAALNEVGEEV
jgi:HD-like signal output (HDOD) protein